MRIGARLRLNTWIILAVMSLMVLFLIWSFWESNKADRNEGLVVEMQRITSEHVVLRDEYLMRREERARVQWNAKTEHFRKLLDNAWGKFTDTRDKEILEGIQKRFDETVLIFSQLTDYREKRKDTGNESSIFPDREMQLISYIIANAYDLMNNINSLRQSASRASNTAHERSTILVIFSMSLVVILTIGNSVIINHILTKRIAELNEGTEIIGAGNLDHQIAVNGNDELSDLARAINTMDEKLRMSYTSIANLEKSRSLLAEIQRIGNVGGWEFDIDTQEQTWTEEVYRIHEVDITYKPTVDQGINFYAPAPRPIIERAVQRAIEHGEPFDVELEIITAKGNLRWVKAIGKTDLEHRRVFGFFQDITERKRAEEALRESQERLKFALDGSNDGLWDVQMDTSAVYLSPRGCEILGYRPEELPEIVKVWSELVHPDDLPATNTALNAYLEGKSPLFQVEQRLRMASGEWKWILARGKAVERDLGGAPTRMVGTHTDITERKRIEEELRKLNIELEQRVADRTAELSERIKEVEQLNRATSNLLEDLQASSRRATEAARQLEAKNREMEAFNYSVSHDLKAPLRGIDGYSRLLLEDYTDRLDEEGRYFLKTIRDSVSQMSQLIDDLLSYSRIECRSFVARQVDPRTLVEAVLTEHAGELKERNVTVNLDILCTSVTAEAEGLIQVFRNLIDNAIKFTRGIPGPQIEISSQETEKSCIMSIYDNGIGFDMKYHDRIFDIFQRLHRAEDYPGTGIGLAIVRKAVERMGGRVWAESKPGEGATFYVEVPR